MTALHWASVYGQLELLQILLQYGAKVDKTDIVSILSHPYICDFHLQICYRTVAQRFMWL